MYYKSSESKIKYLKLLARQYPNLDSACTEIINLKATLSLPKGTEHFVSDIHGEYGAFSHVLRNASGVIKDYVEELFGSSLMDSDKKNLATLVYYPELKLEVVRKKEHNMDDWYRINLFRLIQICKRVSSKYTRSKVRKAIHPDFVYILEELLHEDIDRLHKHEYYNEIINTIVKLGRADKFIVAMSNLIQRLAIEHLHVIGDIYDRGDGADKIMDILANYHSIDVQWGNHDISWMGAASGSEACICNVIRISIRYYNLRTLEEAYGINLVPLASFAMDVYKDDNCKCFEFKRDDIDITAREKELIVKMHKAITVIQFKIEGQTILRNPEFNLNNRTMLDKINFEKGTINIDGVDYLLNDTNFPTINPNSPFELTEEEKSVIDKIKLSFLNSEKLQMHVKFLFNKGSMYTVYNSNLLFHGCIPLNEDGTFKEVSLFGENYKGKALLDKYEEIIRKGFFLKGKAKEKRIGLDYMWYLWCGNNSPLYGKEKMTTFERYFISDKSTHKEEKNPYYQLRNKEETCIRIFEEFNLDSEISHIINGHVPVKVVKGENPVKANGKLLVIDGGFAKAYQNVTGIAGYTLIYNSRGLVLASHEPFSSIQEAVEEERDIISSTTFLGQNSLRKMVSSTDVGKELETRIKDLEELVKAYNNGTIKESVI